MQEKFINFEASNLTLPHLLMNILVIRFRQMGDAILATSLLNTLRQNFGEAKIDFVLNQRIAPLFEGHPSIDRIITFSDSERHHTLSYLRKVWQIVHNTHYDIIIDMRSTVNTMLFALMSPQTKYRIGVDKGYTKIAFNHLIDTCGDRYPMVEYDVSYAHPLNSIKPIKPCYTFNLKITDKEKLSFKQYLINQGVELSRPIMLANVTAKLAHKVWKTERMAWVLQQFMQHYPDYQIIFNYAPGQEEKNARNLYEMLGQPKQVLIDVQAHSSRELVAMGCFMTLFFGNEGGARHIMQAVGCPSLAICAPENNKRVWITQTDILAEGISPVDVVEEDDNLKQKYPSLTREEKYDLLTQEYVWQKLELFMNKI